MTVANLRAEMSQDEFIRWNVYYARRGQDQQIAMG